MKDLLLVVGMHRSGTSLVTRVVNLLGADLGRELLPPKEDNPEGFWENAAIVRAHDDFLWATNRLWDNPFALDASHFRSTPSTVLVDRLVEILDDEFKGNLVAVKDPRLCRVLPAWKEVAAKAGYRLAVLFVLRDPREVQASLTRRDNTPEEQAAMLWARYMLEAEAASRDLPRAFVEYASLLENWEGVLQGAMQRLGLSWQLDENTRTQINGFVRKGLRHHSASGMTGKTDALWTDLVMPLHEVLQAACGSGAVPPAELNALSDVAARMERAYTSSVQDMDREIFQRRAEILELRDRVSVEEARVHHLEAMERRLSDYLRQETADKGVLQQQLDLVHASTSWRVTAPLRFVSLWIRKLRFLASRTGVRALLRDLYYKLPLPWRVKRLLRNLIGRALSLPTAAGSPGHGHGPFSARLQASSVVPPDSARVHSVLEGRAERPPLSTSDQPVASVVIPVYNKVEHTVACLLSIADNVPELPFEVIVVDDGSSDDTAEIAGHWPGVRYTRNPENLGFIGACNRGADQSRGEFVCFLNNDTNVLKGWLDALVETFESESEAGLVGSKLVYPDGRLQEAGGIVWRDGSAWNYGRMQDPDAPVYSYLREVDYVSGASILLRRTLFLELGGFDSYYKPAYYEDTDLALKIRQRGLRVLLQPESMILHYEGISSGTDVSKGIKRFQAINEKKFLERWQETLVNHRENGQLPEREKERNVQRRLLMIDATLPFPDQDAGSVIADHFIRIFQGMGYKVTFMPENLEYSSKYTSRLQRRGVECIYHPHANGVRDFIRERGAEFDLVFVARPYVAEGVVSLIKHVNPEAPIIYNTCDLHFLREERQAVVENNPLIAERARKTKVQELRVIRDASCTIVVSPVEKEILAREVPDARVEVIQLIQERQPTGPGWEQRDGMLFIGGFQHHPNADAIIYFVNEILPVLRSNGVREKLYVVGSKPTPEVLALASDDVEILGFVEDIEPILHSVRSMIVPLRYGAGVKGKIGTAFAYGLPVVSSTVGVEGMNLEEGRHYARADSANEWLEALQRLSTDSEFWNRLASSGLEIVDTRYSPLSVAEKLGKVLRELGEGKQA